MKEHVLPLITKSKGSEKFYNLDLCYVEDQHDVPPKITFIHDEGVVGNIDHLDISGSELVKHSFQNLTKIDIRPADASKNDVGLFHFDQKHASEKILDKKFMAEISEQLGTETILASIPARGTLLICASNNNAAFESLVRLSQKIYNDFTKEAISTLVFTIENGSIKSTSSPKMNYAQLDESTTVVGSYEEDVSKIKLFQELFNYRILAKADKIEDLQNGLFQSVLKLLKQSEYEKHFEKGIEIISSGNEITNNRTNIGKIKSLFDKIAHNFEPSSIHSKEKPYKISFQFHEDFQKGNSHNKIVKHLK